MSWGERGWSCTHKHGEVPEGCWEGLGDQGGQGVHQAPRVCCRAGWRGHGLPHGTAGGGQGEAGKTTPAETESKPQSVGPSLGLGSGVCLSCLVTCLL